MGEARVGARTSGGSSSMGAAAPASAFFRESLLHRGHLDGPLFFA